MEKFIKLFADGGWKELLGSDFNRGFIAALALILALLLLLMLIRLMIFWTFRLRRSAQIIVNRPDGATQVSRAVLTDLVRGELRAYPALESRRVALYRDRKSYVIAIFCAYSLKDSAGIPAFCDEFKPKLLESLKRSFGIESVREVRLCIESSGDTGEPVVPPPASNVYSGV